MTGGLKNGGDAGPGRPDKELCGGLKGLKAQRIPLLGLHPEKSRIQMDTRSPKFTEALFTIAKTWKQPKCPSTEEWEKMVQIYSGILLSKKRMK